MFSTLRRSACVGLFASALLVQATLAAEGDYPLDLRVENASAKVGEPTTVIATIIVEDGYKAMSSYRNRIIELSSFDEGVDFDKPVVVGTLENGELVFNVGVTPTKPGEHPINGVFRVGYHNGEQAKMVSIPLMATVTGTE
jgi:hypothetical protein